MNILLLGGNRFFGKKLLKKLSTCKTINIYVLNRGNKKIETNILKKKNVIFLRCDRKNKVEMKKILQNIRFDLIFDNCAYEVNDVKNLLQIVNNKNVVYLFSSTVMSYLNLYLKETLHERRWHAGSSTRKMKGIYMDHELNYAKNKRKIEKFLIKNKKIKYIILRIHNVIGIDDFSKKTFKLFMSSIAQAKKYNINEYDNFQFTYDQDLIKIIYQLIISYPKKSNVFNICNDPINVKQFYRLKNRYFQKKLVIINDEKFPLPKNVIMDNTKIKNKLNFNFTPITKIVKKMVSSNEFK